MTVFDFSALVPAGSPAPAVKWRAAPKYNFIGGHNDSEELPLEGLTTAANAVLSREGRRMSDYRLHTGPQGYQPLREFLAKKLKRDAGIACTFDDILIVSGSLQALDLINAAMLTRGDTVVCEKDNYEGTLNRFYRLGVKVVDVPLDSGGMRMDALEQTLEALKQKGVKPKFIYTIPTVQNPTATIMDEERRTKLLALAVPDQVRIAVVLEDRHAVFLGDRDEL